MLCSISAGMKRAHANQIKAANNSAYVSVMQAPKAGAPASSARQCQPPMATWQMVTPLSAATRRGFRSLPLRVCSQVYVWGRALVSML